MMEARTVGIITVKACVVEMSEVQIHSADRWFILEGSVSSRPDEGQRAVTPSGVTGNPPETL